MISRIGRTRLTAIFAALLLAGCLGDSAESLIEKAKSSMGSQDAKSAIIFLKSALQKDGQNGEARFMLGKLLLEAGDYRGALIELQKASDLGFDRDTVLPVLVYAMYANGQVGQLISKYGNASVSSRAANAGLKATLAGAQLAMGKADEAMVLVDEALAANPRYTQGLLLKARLLASKRKFDDAFALLAIAVDTDPKSGEARKLRGDIWLMKGPDNAAAESAYREALEADPKYVPAHVALIWLTLGRKDIPAAQAHLAVMTKASPTHPQTRYLTTIIALDKGDLKLANETVQLLMKQQPDNPQALQLAGAVNLRLGNLVQAEAALGKASSLVPDNQRVRLLLAQTQLRMGDAAKAAKTVQPLLEKSEPSADAIALLAEAELQLGDHAKAEQLYTRAAALDPKDSRSKALRAVAMIEKGQVEKGLEELRNIAATDSRPVADLALVSAQLRRKEYAQALKSLDLLQRKQPKSALVAGLRGDAELRLDHKDAARAAYEAAVALDPVYAPAQLQLANMDAIDGKQDLALQRLKKLVESSPTNARAQLAMAALRKLMGAKSDELVTLLNNAIKANPTSAELRLGLVQQYLMESQPKLALDAAQEGVSAVPDSLELLAALGRTQLMAGDVNQARISFGKVIKSAPNSAQAHIEMADLQLGQRDFEGAMQSLRKAVALAPDNMPAQAKLISLEMNAGRPADALALARKVQAQRPQSAIGYMFEGDILGEQGKWPAAAKTYQTGMDKQPSTALSVKLHMALTKAGRVADADRQAKAWLQANPKDIVYLNYQGDVQLQRNELVSARQFYERALAAKPNLPAALNNLGWVLSRLKQPGALESVNRALQLVPNQPTFLDTQAEIYAGQGDLKKAIEVQKSAVAAGPDAHLLRLRLAKYYIAAGQPAAAKQELDVLAKLGDAFPQQAEVKQLRAKL